MPRGSLACRCCTHTATCVSVKGELIRVLELEVPLLASTDRVRVGAANTPESAIFAISSNPNLTLLPETSHVITS